VTPPASSPATSNALASPTPPTSSAATAPGTPPACPLSQAEPRKLPSQGADIRGESWVDFVVGVELAAEAGHADGLAEGEPGEVDAGLGVDEDGELTRAVVDEELEPELHVRGRRLGDRAGHPYQQPLGGFTDGAGGVRRGVDPGTLAVRRHGRRILGD